MTKVAYIEIGIPGAGKSTWFKNQNFPVEHTVRISMDDIREEMTGDVTDQSMNAQVASEAKKRYLRALQGDVPIVVWDATNTRRKYRRELINMAKKNGYETVAVWFDIPLEVAKERNAGRDRVVPEHVLDNMYAALQQNPPTRSEGFDVIQKVS